MSRNKRRVLLVLMLLACSAIGAVVGLLIGRSTGNESRLVLDAETFRIIPAIILWSAFFLYWAIAAQNAGTTESSEPLASARFHQIFLAAAFLLLLIPGTPGLHGRYLPRTTPLLYIGLTIQAVFALLAVWARWHLGRNWSAEVRIAVDHQLVRTGPYYFLRHPIYTAMLGMFLGTAVVSGQSHALLAVLLLAVLYWRKSRQEERILGEAFGAEYDAYRRHTWALVPLVF